MAEILREELLKKVRRIEIVTRKLVNDVMSGQYRSHFKGHGVQFSEHRLYVPGDDVRHIDWKASARSRDPLVKKYEEERELTVFLVVDVSASERFGSTGRLKSEVVAEIGAMLSYAAIQTGDRIGALLFTSEVEKIIPPKKGRVHMLRIVHELLSYQPKKTGTNLSEALDVAGRVMKHAGVVFLLSDFRSEGYQRALQKISTKHDVVAIRVADPMESKIPQKEIFLFSDPETGEQQFVETGSYRFQKFYGQQSSQFEAEFDSAVKKSQVEKISILTQEDYGEAVVRFFQKRRRR